MRLRRSKYNARKTEVDGILFDSKKEAKRYQELRLLESAGQIKALTLQPEFSLCAWSTDHAECPRVGKYRADFSYYELTEGIGWLHVVEDVKGMKTPLYRWKKRHTEMQYGIQIREI